MSTTARVDPDQVPLGLGLGLGLRCARGTTSYHLLPTSHYLLPTTYYLLRRCPLHEGRKWIATMWYREGMTAEKGWEAYRM